MPFFIQKKDELAGKFNFLWGNNCKDVPTLGENLDADLDGEKWIGPRVGPRFDRRGNRSDDESRDDIVV
ncbi:hypothetical protein V1477_018136 [Vespula maculifrons]|uniref:Uncharacterized protein n=1 Tax=Vespula maculifrons TaxID=7453 RepID=A0ABD2AYL2_VESMC